MCRKKVFRYMEYVLHAVVFSVVCFVMPVYDAGNEREFPVTVTGEVTVMHVDDFDNKQSRLLYHLRDIRSNRVFSLRFAKKLQKNFQTGSVVTVRGKAARAG